MNEINLTQHPCSNKCSIYTITCTNCGAMFEDDYDLEQVLVVEDDGEEVVDGCPNCKTDAHLMDLKYPQNSRELGSMGDDAHIENHVSPLCVVDGKTGLNGMEAHYIEKKKQVELLQTEVARLNAVVERQKSEMVAMQARIDELTAENAGLHQAATTHFRNQNHYMDLYHKLVCELYPYALDLGEPVCTYFRLSDKWNLHTAYNKARKTTSQELLQMMQGDEEYIRMQCGMLCDGVNHEH